jgi:hypothetical protein
MADADMTTGNSASHSAPSKTWSLAAIALVVPCGFCWAVPGTACADVGQHYARYRRAYRRGILAAAGLAIVSNASPYITAGTVVPDAQAPARRPAPSHRSAEDKPPLKMWPGPGSDLA